jgi:hypothetical protein
MTAYQEDLMSLDDLRRRMPGLRKREQAISAELNALTANLPTALASATSRNGDKLPSTTT